MLRLGRRLGWRTGAGAVLDAVRMCSPSPQVTPGPPVEPGPEDCCQSGCVRCVWDIYREQLDEHNAALQVGQAVWCMALQ